MMETNKTHKTPNEDLMNEALKHYEEASNAVHHWNSDIPKAIKMYYSQLAAQDNIITIKKKESPRCSNCGEYIANCDMSCYYNEKT